MKENVIVSFTYGVPSEKNLICKRVALAFVLFTVKQNVQKREQKIVI